jgi:membrane-bound metal-dependent hydrolase YbcI (DUF457 family)
VSWAAHELESYFIQKHTKVSVSYLAILIGCLLPDMLTKLPVYGITIGKMALLKAAVPYQYHRGWPGVGFTHTLMFGLLVAVLVFWLTGSREWFLGLLLGQWAHALTDMFDSVGTMVFFPFTTQHYTTGMWAYAAQQGRYGDAAAYYSSLGGIWDLLWLALALTGFRVLSKSYFFRTVVPADPAWGWLRRRFRLSPAGMLALYRAFFLYGACRAISWFLWARFVDHASLDLRWGGPYWVDKVVLPTQTWQSYLENTVVGITGVALTCYLAWRFILRRWWREAGDRHVRVVSVAKAVDLPRAASDLGHD